MLVHLHKLKLKYIGEGGGWDVQEAWLQFCDDFGVISWYSRDISTYVLYLIKRSSNKVTIGERDGIESLGT